MKITIRNVKHVEFASHETNCFEATVYKDGKRWCIASNDGNGGNTCFYPLRNTPNRDLYREIAAYDEQAPTETCNLLDEPFDLKMTLENVIDDLVVDFLTLRDMKTLLKRKVIAANPDSTLSQWDRVPTYEFIKKVMDQNPEATVLNILTQQQALKLWKAAQAL